jgi:hypothetical protein
VIAVQLVKVLFTDAVGACCYGMEGIALQLWRRGDLDDEKSSLIKPESTL